MAFDSGPSYHNYAQNLRLGNTICQDKYIQAKYISPLQTHIAVSNILKSLGPNDQLVNAVAELQILLNSETATVVAHINKRTHETDKRVIEASKVGTQINIRTVKIQEDIVKGNAIITAIDERTVQVQETLEQTASQGVKANEHLLVRMDRLEGLSVDSRTSIEEVKEKVEAFLTSTMESTHPQCLTCRC
jgi:hypothetical protein